MLFFVMFVGYLKAYGWIVNIVSRQIASLGMDIDFNIAIAVLLVELVEIGFAYQIITMIMKKNNKNRKFCQRCKSPLTNGFCTNGICPFNTHQQYCERGWEGHPEHLETPLYCSCNEK